MPEAEVRFASKEEYDHLREIRDRHGVVWRGMLLQGARQVVGYDLHRALLQLDSVSVEDERARSHPQKHPAIDVYSPSCTRESDSPGAKATSHPVSSEIAEESQENDTIPGGSWEPPYAFDAVDSGERDPEDSE
ncbi:hypothetical protein ACOZ4N_00920 (plasmid) [Halorientalis pallida]|uniref:hypothetical protein n=1 Tax=Halorientalis pallida TaxID=2479928 RepID=UPI003C6ECB48